MTRKAIVILLAVMIAMPLITAGTGDRAHAATATERNHPAADIIALTETHLAVFKAAGDVDQPMAQQLGNRLEQARHHLDNGNISKAGQMIGNFLRHLTTPAMQKFISEAARERLEKDAHDIARLLNLVPQPPISIGAGGAADAVIIAEDAANDDVIPGWGRRGTDADQKIHLVDTISYTGARSVRIADDNDQAIGLMSNQVGVQPGEVYTASGMAYVETGSYPVLFLYFYDQSRQLIRSANASTNIRNEWIHLSVTAEAPENAAYAAVYLFSDSIGIRTFYFDDLVLQREGEPANLLTNPGFEQSSNPTAATLVEYVRKATGAELPVMASVPENFDGTVIYIGMSRPEDGTVIYIGMSRPEDAEVHDALLAPLNEHGFMIDAADNRITIRGTTPRATTYGVYEFLERFAGVRWLMPGPDGEHVPQLSAVSVPRELVREQPASVSRHYFGMNGSVGLQWAERNRMHNNIQYHHNMSNLFDPAVFADHPEYYADGVVPTHPYSWQPCFNSVTAQAAIQRIIEYFDNNPDASSYSLGINDGTNYCEKPGHPDYPTKTNSVGKLHRSDVYYRWVNEIAEGVAAVYPDKYLGLLAYREMYDPPQNEDGSPMKLHPNVVPYITDDRMTWEDPVIGAEGKSHTEKWREAADQLGFYEYQYGAQYNVPRVYFQRMADNYKYGADNGVVGYTAELYVNWGEGPKAWLASKLQWNPNQDVDALLNDWYVSAVGEAAAPYLQQYYELWEDIWTSRIFTSAWYQSWANAAARNNYLPFNDIRYMEIMTKEDVTAGRQLLEQAVAAAAASGTDKQRIRAELMLRAFEFYEASVLSYPKSQKPAAPTTEQEALELLDDIKTSLDMAVKRNQLKTEFQGHPVLDLRGYPRGDWNGVQRPMFDALMEYVDTEPEGGPVGTLVGQFLSELPEELRKQFTDEVPDIPNLSATAVRTDAGKETVLQSLDFSQGPWADAVPFNEFLIMNTTIAPPEETKVRLLWDDEYLYVGYENFDGDPSQLKVSEDAPNGWWRDGSNDSVETYITADPLGAYNGYFTNPLTVSFVYQKLPDSNPAPSTDPNWEANANIGSDRWNVIQAIPFSSIGVDPNETTELKGFFFRNYRGSSFYIGWGGGAPWTADAFKPIHLVE